ncbi:protein GET1-like isoform X3 [Tasmannia lanceolata]|uniref:protein GET1-like isoform X3 n=1 Tax=Tasmannia lanceolata TaxID=3420 RepID=UPI00406443CB
MQLVPGKCHIRRTLSIQRIKPLLYSHSRCAHNMTDSVANGPSTFAQAAKLKRMATSKEKELAKIQELENKENKGSYDRVLTALGIVKVLAYLGLSWWFWGVPVATVSQQLLQPFGKMLSWRAGGSLSGFVLVGIIPWLIVTTRVSKFISQKLPM